MIPKPKKSRFALPVALTSTSLAFLFFGFSPAKRPPAAVMPKIIREEGPVIPVVLEPEPPELLDADRAPAAKPSYSANALPPTNPTLSPNPYFDPMLDPIPSQTEALRLPAHQRTEVPGILGNNIGPIGISALDNIPRATFQLAPQYPADLRSLGLAGEVWVEFVVDRTGCVVQAGVLSSSHQGFEKATLRAIEKWRFEPGKIHGVPVSFRMTIPVRFSMDR